MTTDKLHVENNEECMERILAEADRLSEYEKYGAKAALRLRLLAEEAIGMLQGIVGQVDAEIWFEETARSAKSASKGKPIWTARNLTSCCPFPVPEKTPWLRARWAKSARYFNLPL